MPKKIILSIDTRVNNHLLVALTINGNRKEAVGSQSNWSSQLLLPMILDIMKKNKINFQDLTNIEVQRGPGSFTGLRVGIAVANILSWYYKIPLNGFNNRIEEPLYQ